MINFSVNDYDGKEVPIGIPEGIGLSFMEVLKAAGFLIPATCGGLALCATCRVKVLSGADQLLPPADAEQDMLDQLPFSEDIIRLSCQMRVDEHMQNCRFAVLND